MRIFKHGLLFAAINLLVLLLVCLFLLQPFTMDMLLEEAEFQNANAIVIGQSLAQVGIDPQMMNIPGETVFNLSRGAIAVDCLPVLVREADRLLELDTVYLNLDPSYWDSADWLSLISGSVDNDAVALFYRALFHGTGPRYLLTVLDRQPFGNLLFPYSLDKTTLLEIPRTLRRKLSGASPETQADFNAAMQSRNQTTEEFQYRGSGFMYGVSSNVGEWSLYDPENPEPMGEIFSPDSVPAATEAAFRELADYCRSRDIRLICFSTARPPELLLRENHRVPHDYYSALCREVQVPYYDLSYVKMEYIPRNVWDYVDEEGHMLGPIAQRQSALFREILDSGDPSRYFEPDYASVQAGALASLRG